MKLITTRHLEEIWDKANRTLCALESSFPGRPETMYMASLKQIKFLVEQIYAVSKFCSFCRRLVKVFPGECNCPPSQNVRSANKSKRRVRKK